MTFANMKQCKTDLEKLKFMTQKIRLSKTKKETKMNKNSLSSLKNRIIAKSRKKAIYNFIKTQ